MILSDKIKLLLQRHNMTAADLAKELNVTRSAISFWINGTKAPGKQRIVEMSHLFSVEPSFFLDDSEKETFSKYQCPLYEWVQAGTWTDFCQSPSDVDYIDVPYGVPNNCFAVKVRGNSMSRTSDRSICDGSIVFCKPFCQGVPPAEDLHKKVVIAQYRDSATIKEFINDSPCYLAPWNPDRNLYPNLPINEEVRIVGQVVFVQLSMV